MHGDIMDRLKDSVIASLGIPLTVSRIMSQKS